MSSSDRRGRDPLSDAEGHAYSALRERNAALFRHAARVAARRLGLDSAPEEDVLHELEADLLQEWPAVALAEGDAGELRRLVHNAAKRAARRVAEGPSALRAMRGRADVADGLALPGSGGCPVSELAAVELLGKLTPAELGTVALGQALLVRPRDAARALVRVAAYFGLDRAARRPLFAELRRLLEAGSRGRQRLAQRLSRLRRRLRAAGIGALLAAVTIVVAQARSTQSHGESSAAANGPGDALLASTQSARESRSEWRAVSRSDSEPPGFSTQS